MHRTPDAPRGRALRRRVVLPALAVSALAVVPAGAHAAAPAAQQAAARPGALPAELRDPSAASRPKYRWWQPLAATEDDELRAELRQMKEGGAGGAEVIAFNVPGVKAGDPRLKDWGWGTATWEHKTRVSLQAAQDQGLSYGMTISPLWPASIPGLDDVNDRRIQQQLVFAHQFVPAGQTRTGALPANDRPAPPAGARTTTVAVLAARCVDADCATQTSGSRLLDRASVRDVTADVDADGDLSWTAPDDGGTWVLIAFRQTASGQAGSPYTAPNADTFPSGKGYVVDHLSTEGARLTTDFWDEHLLTPQVRQLVDGLEQGTEFFEDSLELDDTTKWTWDFAREWTARRGYDPLTSLPALAGAGKLTEGEAVGGAHVPFFDFPDGLGDRVRDDYRQTWSDLYVDRRLKTLRAWAHRRGMTTRAQTYGEPIDTAYASSLVDVPEGESFGFANDMERFKVATSGARRSGAPVVSTELGAKPGGVWNTTQAGHDDGGQLNQVYKAYAAGANQVVWHGFPYLQGPAGTGVQSVWPGWTFGGNTSFSEAWGPRMPQWGDAKALNDHLGRLQAVLRQGDAAYDVGVLWGRHATTAGILKSDNPLSRAGYTNDYLSPESLRSSDATVAGGRLFPDGSALKALVIRDQPTMPVDVARRIRDLARDGLPVVVVGDLPATTPGAEDPAAEDARLSRVLAELVALPTVRRVAGDDALPAALQGLGVRASAARESGSSALLTVRRRTADAAFVYLFNQRPERVTDTVTLEGRGRPYLLDTWTGKATPVATYRRTDDGVVLPVALAGNDQQVVVLTDDAPKVLGVPEAPALHAERTDAAEVVPGAAAPLAVRATAAGRVATTLSDGRTVATDVAAVPAARTLGAWSLSVQSWRRGASGAAADTVKETLPTVDVTAGDDGRLPAWSAIPALQDVSGVGTYRTTLRLDGAWTGGFGAYLDLGRVVDSVRVTVNGRATAPVDPMDPRVDVGPYLHGGDNAIEVRVASTLLNAVRATPGTGAGSRARADYGLMGPVRLRPYGEADVASAAAPTPPPAPAPAPGPAPAPAPPTPAAKAPRLGALGTVRRATLLRRGVLVRVTTPTKGRIALTLQRGRRSVGSATRTVTRPGAYRVRVRLSASGRRQLRALKAGRTTTLKVRAQVRVDGRLRTVKRVLKVRG
ncbi:glycosyl hydrolase [Patulibacter sp. SYSU D01012]|uniref:glycosyl hydrolase n=1 Tax=Patulibacter sp. SYSU D01012 TaxID=2817381 RepID=UPI001B306DBC|nr:glycosyl hydrolase [Patulibacter sp. SYSU D01012]